MVKFGPAGNSPLFYESGGKSSDQVPAWLKSIGLSAYEYQCGRGVRIGEQTARKISAAAREAGIAVSLHAPYYINLASKEAEGRKKSQNHILKSLRAADWLGASPVVFHPGGVGGLSRKEALDLALTTLEEILELAQKEGLTHIKLAPETMGKQNQLGSLEEVIALCKLSPQVIPTVDFAHLHAVGGGCLCDKSDFEDILAKIEGALGSDVVQYLHVHFSPIEYTEKGEKRHRNLEDKNFGPDFLPLAEIIKENSLSPTIICESNGKQAEDALAYQKIYRSL